MKQARKVITKRLRHYRFYFYLFSIVKDSAEHNNNEEVPNSTPLNSEMLSISNENPYPTDKAKFNSILLTADEKRFVIANGPCKPTGPFPIDKNSNTRFSSYFYHTKNKAGIQIPRTWLCYSQTLDYAYCEACWLFADTSNKMYRSHGWMEFETGKNWVTKL